MRTDEVYRLRDVEVTKGAGAFRFRLRVPAFALRRGEIHVVTGPSGCGKSTLLGLLGLLLRPSASGEFLLRPGPGLPPIDIPALPQTDRAGVRRSIFGHVLQSGDLLPYLSVEANILLPQELNGFRDRGFVRTLAARLGIEAQLSQKPRDLSGGERQRAAIARALTHRPAIVLADEPTASVDVVASREIFAQFQELARESSMALVLATHDVALARRYADHLYRFEALRDGDGAIVSTLLEEPRGNAA